MPQLLQVTVSLTQVISSISHICNRNSSFHILLARFPLDGVLAAVTEDASGTGLCKLCRVRFRPSIFGESAVGATLLASFATDSTAGSADVLAFRDGTGVAGKQQFADVQYTHMHTHTHIVIDATDNHTHARVYIAWVIKHYNKQLTIKIVSNKPYGHDASHVVVRIAASYAAINWIPCLPYFGFEREKYGKFGLFPTFGH